MEGDGRYPERTASISLLTFATASRRAASVSAFSIPACTCAFVGSADSEVRFLLCVGSPAPAPFCVGSARTQISFRLRAVGEDALRDVPESLRVQWERGGSVGCGSAGVRWEVDEPWLIVLSSAILASSGERVGD